MNARTRPWWSAPAARGTATLLAVLLLGAAWHGDGAFHRFDLHLVLWDSIAIGGIVAVGECLVILGGGIDLSVGAVTALTGTACAGLMLRGGWGFAPALLASLLLGALVGAANGVLVARWRLQPFLVTLATMVIARGMARWLPQLAHLPAGAKFMPADGRGPEAWHVLADRIGGLPVTGLAFLAVAAVALVAVRGTVVGRHLAAIGGNEEAARLCGVPTQRVKALAYTACGALAGFAGVCTTARNLHGDPGSGELLELQAIAAVVVGGTALQGGRGGIGLAVLGVFTIGYIDKVLSINDVESHWRLVIQGCIILAAVLFQERRP